MSVANGVLNEERRRLIVEMLHREGRVLVTSLARHFRTYDRMGAGRSGGPALRRRNSAPSGQCDAVIELASEKTGARFFEAVESGEPNGLDDIIVLRFSCLPEARA